MKKRQFDLNKFLEEADDRAQKVMANDGIYANKKTNDEGIDLIAETSELKSRILNILSKHGNPDLIESGFEGGSTVPQSWFADRKIHAAFLEAGNEAIGKSHSSHVEPLTGRVASSASSTAKVFVGSISQFFTARPILPTGSAYARRTATKQILAGQQQRDFELTWQLNNVNWVLFGTELGGKELVFLLGESNNIFPAKLIWKSRSGSETDSFDLSAVNQRLFRVEMSFLKAKNRVAHFDGLQETQKSVFCPDLVFEDKQPL